MGLLKSVLDRYLVFSSWLDLFPLAQLSCVFVPYSDHKLIEIQLCPFSNVKKVFRFRFKNQWLRECDFGDIVGILVAIILL